MSPADIDKLANYHGLTPEPEGFDAFWEARMAEAEAAPLEWEVTPSEIPAYPTCEFLDLWFRGLRGERLHAKYLRPVSDEPLPLVLQFHGYPGTSRSWFEQASFAGMGMALVALDNPGQGGPSRDAGGYDSTTVMGHLIAGIDGDPADLYYVRLYQNVRVLCRIVRELGGIDLSRVYVNGASQGGGMGLACAALNPGLMSRACILYPFLSDMREVFELGLDVEAYDGLRYYARWFDPDGERLDEWFGKLAYYETNHLAKWVRCPVLFGTGLEDTVVPPQTQCATYNALACEKERHLYAGFGHEEIQDFDDLIIDYLDGRVARYEELSTEAPDGTPLRLMHVAAPVEGQRPVVLLFHDCTRPARGWHHITRFVALGYDVVQLESRPGAGPGSYATSAADALAAFDLASSLPNVDQGRVIAFGEGFGGSLALAVAAGRPVWKAAALNPHAFACLVEGVRDIACPVLLGTGRLDEVSLPDQQDSLAAGIARLVRKNYPRHAHERINAFEDELLTFIHD
ncbi:MAG: acetylxylan esterase [Atopobiaceae bacterium]|nr:acetylxylan esterase [Atopobiaceae bacterium]